MLLNSIAFSGLILAEGQESANPAIPLKLANYNVRDLFTRALNSGSKCKNDVWQVTLDQGEVWLNFFEGQHAEAQRWLAQARKIPERSAVDDLELLDAEAQLAIAAGKGAEAKSLFKALDDLS